MNTTVAVWHLFEPRPYWSVNLFSYVSFHFHVFTHKHFYHNFSKCCDVEVKRKHDIRHLKDNKIFNICMNKIKIALVRNQTLTAINKKVNIVMLVKAEEDHTCPSYIILNNKAFLFALHFLLYWSDLNSFTQVNLERPSCQVKYFCCGYRIAFFNCQFYMWRITLVRLKTVIFCKSLFYARTLTSYKW